MIVFETPSLLDLKAITTFGLHAKPNSTSPIGHFGTGLKYALAVLLRSGCKVSIIIDGRRVDFSVVEKEFRGEKFGQCMAKAPGSVIPGLRKSMELPFTCSLGKGWALWQAFRELFSNTLDEGGGAYHKADDWQPKIAQGRTFILVGGENFETEFANRWENFLEDGVREKGHGVQIIDRPSKYVYYRGVRVMDLKRPSLVTYNILGTLDLTEDRTAKYSFYVDSAIRTAIMQHTDRELISRLLDAGDESYEGALDFTDMTTWVTPSAEFLALGARCNNSSVRRFIRRKAITSATTAVHYTQRLVDAIDLDDWDLFRQIAEEHKDELYTLLKGVRPADTDPESEFITTEETSDE